VVELCCGSGAIGAAVIRCRPGIELHVADIDEAAVACARRNLEGLGVDVHRGDLFDALPGDLRGRVDVLVANVPYVPTADIELLPREARDYEPWAALDGGDDGLDMVRRLLGGCPAWLSPGGSVLVEISERQARTAMQLAAAAPLAPRLVSDDDLEATVVIGTRIT